MFFPCSRIKNTMLHVVALFSKAESSGLWRFLSFFFPMKKNLTFCSGFLLGYLDFLMLSQGQTGFMGFEEDYHRDEVPFSSHHVKVHATNLAYR